MPDAPGSDSQAKILSVIVLALPSPSLRGRGAGGEGIEPDTSQNQAVSHQATSSVLMVRPATAAANPETAATNAFQAKPTPGTDLHQVQAEFDNAVETLLQAGVDVTVVQDTSEPSTPDAHFPNNWFSTHEPGLLVLYPMLAQNRAAEAKPAPLELLKSRYEDVLDLRAEPPLEGTGSLVLDRINRRAFAALSPRTSESTAAKWAESLGYDLTTFHAIDQRGEPIYHTNVMMAVGTDWCVWVPDTIADPQKQDDVREHFSDRQIIELGLGQMNQYAANMLELKSQSGQPVIALSTTALAALEPAQVLMLEHHAILVPLHIPTIELLGGGSARCMIAELF